MATAQALIDLLDNTNITIENTTQSSNVGSTLTGGGLTTKQGNYVVGGGLDANGNEITQVGSKDRELVMPGDTTTTGTVTSKAVVTAGVASGTVNCESTLTVGGVGAPGTVEVNGSIKSTSFTSEHTLASTTVLTNLNARVVIAAHGYEISNVTTDRSGNTVVDELGEEALFYQWCSDINAEEGAADDAYLKLFTMDYWTGIKVLPLGGGDFWTQYGAILEANYTASPSPTKAQCAKVWGSILEHIRGIPSDNQLQDSKSSDPLLPHAFRLKFEYKLIADLSPDDQLVGVPQRKLTATASGAAGPYTEAYKALAGFNMNPTGASSTTPAKSVITIPNTHLSGGVYYNDATETAPESLCAYQDVIYQQEKVSFQRGVELMISFRAARYTKSTPGGTAVSTGDGANPQYPLDAGGNLDTHTNLTAEWVTVQPKNVLDLSGIDGPIAGLDFDPWYAEERVGQGVLWTKIAATMIDNACSQYFGAPSSADGTFTTSQKREAFYFGLNYETQRGLVEELAFHEFMIGTDLEIYEGKAAFTSAMQKNSDGYDAAVDIIYTTTDTIKLLAVKTAKAALDAERELRRALTNSLEAAWKAKDVQNTVDETARLARKGVNDLSGDLADALLERERVANLAAANLASETAEALAERVYNAGEVVRKAEEALLKQKLFLQVAEAASAAAKLTTVTLDAASAAALADLNAALDDTATATGKANITISSTVTSDEEINQWYEDNSLYESLKLGYIQMKNLEFRNYVEVDVDDPDNDMDEETETIFCGSAAYQDWESGSNTVFKRSDIDATAMMTGERVGLDEPGENEKSTVYMTADYDAERVPRFSLKIKDLVGGDDANFLTPYYANATRFATETNGSGVTVVQADEVRLAWNNVVGYDAVKQLKLEKSNRIYKVALVPELTMYKSADPDDASGSAMLTSDHLKVWVDSDYAPVGYSDDAGLSSHTITQVHQYATLNANDAAFVEGEAVQAFSISGDIQRTENASGFIVARSRRDNISFNPSLHGVHATGDLEYVHFYTSNALRLFMNQVTKSIFNLEDYSFSVKQDIESANGSPEYLNVRSEPVRIHRIRYCTTHKAMANTTTLGNNLEGMQINGRDNNQSTGCAKIGNTVGQNGNGDLVSFSWSGSYDLSGNTKADANASYGRDVLGGGRPQIFAPTGFGAEPLNAFPVVPTLALDGPNNILSTTAIDFSVVAGNAYTGLAYHFFDHANGWANCVMGLGEFSESLGGALAMPLAQYQLQAGRGLRTTSKYSTLPKAQYLVIDSNQKTHTTNSNQSSSTLFVATSDRRLKDNIVTISNAFEIVNGLRGVAWDWKKNGVHAAGVIAQELQASPAGYAVHELAPCSELGGKEGYLSVEYNCLWGYMIEAFKEQSRRVAELQKEVLALKEK